MVLPAGEHNGVSVYVAPYDCLLVARNPKCRTSLRRFLNDVACCSDTWPDWTPPLQRTRSWSKLLLSSPDTSPTLSGGELLDILVTLGSLQIGNGTPLSIRREWKKAQDHGHDGESSQRTSAVYASWWWWWIRALSSTCRYSWRA